jgi:hypothetical protein
MTDDRPIGMASMKADGTIVLDLRAESPEGDHGLALFEYPPSHPEYGEILDHLGGLQPGESKLVPPWEEDAP